MHILSGGSALYNAGGQKVTYTGTSILWWPSWIGPQYTVGPLLVNGRLLGAPPAQFLL